MNGRLTGKRALITGAASGMGRAMAVRMAAEGARVAVHARTREKTEPVLQSIRDAGGDAFGVVADLTDNTAIETMCEAARHALGGIDIVVNNAGLFGIGRILDVELRDWALNFQVHVTAPMLVTRYTVPTMIEHGEGGSLVYIGSTSSTQPDPDWVAYTASKHAVVGLMRAAAADFGKHGIRANLIAPAWVDTPMAERYFRDTAEQAGKAFDAVYDEGIRAGVLNTRISPDSIAELAVFLAADSGRHLTGQVLSVCGGSVMR